MVSLLERAAVATQTEPLSSRANGNVATNNMCFIPRGLTTPPTPQDMYIVSVDRHCTGIDNDTRRGNEQAQCAPTAIASTTRAWEARDNTQNSSVRGHHGSYRAGYRDGSALQLPPAASVCRW